MKKGKFVIISGPSGVGKDTICDELVKKGVGRYSVSMTTRKKRSNEIEGISYFFVSKEEFERHIEEDYFLEYAMYNGNYYGTPNEFIKETTNNGNNVIRKRMTRQDINGVYEANVFIQGVKKKAKSTFFPRNWSPQKVVNSINEACRNKIHRQGNLYEGSSEGIRIWIYLDESGKIKSAHPIMEKE